MTTFARLIRHRILCLGVALCSALVLAFNPPVLAQALSPSDAGFWVVLPNGARLPYNHPLAEGAARQPTAAVPAPTPSAPVSSSRVLTPSDEGFWIRLSNGALLPYNHPDAIAALGTPPPAAAPAPTAAPAPAPTAPVPSSRVLTPSDPGFWIVLPDGSRLPYNHPLAIAAAKSAPIPAPSTPAHAPPVVVVPAPAPPPPPVAPVASGSARLRVLQWNLHHGVGTDGKYDIDRLATWMTRMQPDIIVLNEVEKNTGWGNEDQPARYKALVQAKTGRTWYSSFAQEFGSWNANGKGNLILSTFPIESIDRVAISYDRVISNASIVVNGRSLSLLVTHLDPDSPTRRLEQAKQVIIWAAAHPENRILTGDMNAWPDQSSIAELNRAYTDTWTAATSRGTAYQVSGLTPDGATKKGRIDYIFMSKSAPNLAVLSSQVYDTRDGSGQMPSDHRPVLTTFEVR